MVKQGGDDETDLIATTLSLYFSIYLISAITEGLYTRAVSNYSLHYLSTLKRHSCYPGIPVHLLQLFIIRISARFGLSWGYLGHLAARSSSITCVGTRPTNKCQYVRANIPRLVVS